MQMQKIWDQKNLQERIYKAGVIAVLVIDDADAAVPLAHALLKGGIDAIELTLRTPAAMDAIKEIKSNVPGEQVRQVVELGADFGVAPGLNPKIVKESQKLGFPFCPGIMTPSDIEAAVSLGCRLLKFFPAEPAGGVAYLKSMAGPYGHLNLRFIPLGGLNERNLASYLQLPIIPAVGGSWIAKRDVIRKRDWNTIARNAEQAMKIVKKMRGE